MTVRELLGVILLREGVLQAWQLERALDHQQSLRAQGEVQALGQVLLQLGLANEGQLQHALRLQRRLAWAPDQPAPLGVRLVEGGVISPSVLACLLDEGDRLGQGLEQLLVERALVPPLVLEHFRARAS